MKLTSKTPYADIYAAWWSAHKVTLRPSTAGHMEIDANAYILPRFGPLPLKNISSDKLQKFIAELAERGKTRFPGGLSPATISHVFTILKLSMAWAVEAGILRESPCAGVKTPPVRHLEREIFSHEEVRQLITFQKSQWMADVIEIAYRTGLRRGEIFGLRWGDIDLPSCKLAVQRQITALRYGQRLEGLPKTAASRRVIYLDSKMITLLERRRAVASTEYVIDDDSGGLPSPWTASQRMRYTCQRLSIKQRGLHCLRHTHATMLLGAGVNPKVVQERLGHASLEMTLGVYGHVLPSMQAAAVEVLEHVA